MVAIVMVCWVCHRLALADQTKRLRASTVAQSEELGRLKSELMSEKVQK